MTDSDYEIDGDDFEDFNFDDFDIGSMDADIPDDRNAVGKVSEIALDGWDDISNDKGLHRNLTDNMLPEGYRAAREVALDSVYDVSRMMSRAKSDSQNSINSFKKSTNKLLNNNKSVLPESLYNRLNKLTQTQDGYGPTNADETRISNEIGSMATALAEIQGVNAVMEQGEKEIDRAEAKVKHKESMTTLANLGVKLDRTIAFNERYAATYYQKALDTQLRSYFAQRDLLELTKRSNVDIVNNLKLIAKNSSLPDVVKMRSSEHLSTLMEASVFGGLTEKASDFSNGFRSKVFNKLQQRITDAQQMFVQSLDGVGSGIDMANQMHDSGMSTGFDPTKSAIKMAMSFGASTGGKALTDKIREVLLNDPDIALSDAQLKSGMQQLDTFIPYLLEKNKGRNETLDNILTKAQEFLPTFAGQNQKVAHSFAKKANDPVPFNLLAHKSLTEIIPELLSLQLHELRIGNGMDPNADRLVWNSHREAMTGSRTLQGDVLRKVIKRDELKDSKESLNNAFDNMFGLGAKNFSPEEREIVQRQLLSMANNGTHFNLSNISDISQYDDPANPHAQSAIRKMETHFQSNAERVRTERMMGNVSRNAKAALPNIEERLRNEVGLNHKEALRAAGIIYSDVNGVDQVDNVALKDSIFGSNYFNFGAGKDFDIGYTASPGISNLGVNQANAPSRGMKRQRGFIGNFDAANNPNSNMSDGLNAIREAIIEGNQSRLRDNIASDNLDVTSRIDATNEHLVIIKDLLATSIQVQGTGNISLSAEDLAAITSSGTVGKVFSGLGGGIRTIGRGVSSLYGKLFEGGSSLISTGFSGAKRATSDLWSTLTDKVTNSDIYINGQHRVAITRKQLESGELIDELTGKVISCFEDITGPVKDRLGNYLVSPEDFSKGFADNQGRSLLSKGLEWVTTKPTEWLGNYYGFIFNRLPQVVTTVVKGALSVINPITDVYVTGNPRPVLLARLIKSGGYRNANGSVITKLDDITGDVYDDQNNIVLTVEEMKDGLVDVNGKSIESKGILNITGSILGTMGSMGINSIKWAGTSISNIYKRVFGLGESEGKGLFEGLRGFFSSKTSLMRVTADTVIIEGSGIETSDLNRREGESPDDYASRLTETAARVKEHVTKGAASIKEQGEAAYTEAKTKGDAYYEDLTTRTKDLHERASQRAEEAEASIRASIEDPEGLYQQTKAKGQSKIDAMVESLTVLKDDAIARAKSMRKGIHDSDGDGDRDGNFRDRLAGFKNRLNPFGSGTEDTQTKGQTVRDDSPGFLGTLLNGLGGLGGLGGMAPMLMKLVGMGGMFAGLSSMFGGSSGTGESGGFMGMSPSMMAMLGTGAMMAPGLATTAIKGASKLAWGGLKGAGRLGGLVGRQGAKGALTALMRTPGLIGGGLRLGAGAIGMATGALNPVMWGATAAYAGYKGYKFIARRSEVELLESLRFAHYGFAKTEMDKIVQLRFMEDNLASEIAYDEKGKAYLKRDMSEIIGEFADDFGVNVEDETQLYNFCMWFLKRFNPAFCKQHEVLNAINTRIDLLDIDDELDDHEKIKFATSIWLTSNGEFQPYEVGASPFPYHTLITGTSYIKGIESEVVSKFQQVTNEHLSRKQTVTVTEQGQNAYGNNTYTKPSFMNNGYSVIPTVNTSTSNTKKAGWMPVGDLKFDKSLLAGTSVDEKPLGQIESLRMHYYGLSEISGHELYCIRALENYVASKVDDTGWFSSMTDPSLDTDARECWDKFALLFGWNPKEQEAKRRWMLWFNNRFTVIFLYHQGLLGELSPGTDVIDLDKKLSNAKKIEFLSAFAVTSRAKPENVLVSPFPNKMITTNMTNVVQGVSAIRTALASGKELLHDPVKKLIDKTKAPNKETPTGDGYDVDTPTTEVNKALDKPAEKPKGSGVLKLSNLFKNGTYGGNGGSTTNTTYDRYKAANGAKQDPWTGSGPIEDRIKMYGEIIAEMSAKYGVPQDLIRAIIQQESAGHADARSNVGAMGLMQLMPNTAKDMGVTNAFDPKQNIEGGTKYIAQQLRWVDGNVPLALAGYNGGRAYVIDAKRKAKLALGREPSTQEILDFLPKASHTNKNTGRVTTPDYKQMWGYVNKIVPNYAKRSGVSVDSIMGGAPQGTNLAKTSSGKSVPTNNAVNNSSSINVVRNSNPASVSAPKTPSMVLGAKQEADREVKEAQHQAIQTRNKEEQVAATSSSLSVLGKQLSVLRDIRKGIDKLVEASVKEVVTAKDNVERKATEKTTTVQTKAASYQSTPSSIDMG